MATHPPLYVCALNAAMFELFRRNRLFTHATAGERWRLSENVYFPLDTQIEPYANIWAGYNFPARMGAFSYTHSKCDFRLTIGRYSSIGHNVTWLGDAHPTDWVTASPFAYEPSLTASFDAYLADRGAPHRANAFDQGERRIEIGNDVWIGQNVLIRRGVSIGDGAVVGAGSVVTKSVAPYAIVAGNPARLLRYRFSDDIVERMLKAQWWQYGIDVLNAFDLRDPQRFLDELEKLSPRPLEFSPMTGHEILHAANVDGAVKT